MREFPEPSSTFLCSGHTAVRCTTPGGAFRLGDDGELDIVAALVWAAVQSSGRIRPISNPFLLREAVGEDVLGSQRTPRGLGIEAMELSCCR